MKLHKLRTSPNAQINSKNAVVNLSSPDIGEIEWAYVLKVLQTPHLSLGPKLREFEEKFSKYIGTRYAVAVNSGTSGLHLCIKALGIDKGDEVITTPFSFIASANCILFESATPIFVDISPLTLNIDISKIEEKIRQKTKAILAVDIFGHPAKWDELEALAKKHGLKLIEDSCEALGAEYKDRKAGSFGDAAVFGFYPNKQITTGEGGMIVTNDEKIAKLCRSLRNQGRAEGNEWLCHARLGYNYRISDINCALGIAQMERVEEILAKRERIARMYNERLKKVEGIKIPYVANDVEMSWFVYVVRLEDRFTRTDRDRILKALKGKGIGCSNYFPPIHLQPFYVDMFGYKKGDFPITEAASERTIALPFYNNLREEDIHHVVEILKQEIEKT